MRAEEFVGEKINPDTTKTGFNNQQLIGDQWLLTSSGETRQYGSHTADVLHVKLFDQQTKKELAWVDFLVKSRKEDGEQYLESVYTYVNPANRGQGLSKVMYQYANSLGNDIRPSELQTDMGKSMWKGLSGSVKQPPEPATPVKPSTPPSVWQRIKKAIA